MPTGLLANTLDKPDVIKPVAGSVLVEGQTIHLVLPASSAGVVSIEMGHQ